MTLAPTIARTPTLHRLARRSPEAAPACLMRTQAMSLFGSRTKDGGNTNSGRSRISERSRAHSKVLLLPTTQPEAGAFFDFFRRNPATRYRA